MKQVAGLTLIVFSICLFSCSNSRKIVEPPAEVVNHSSREFTAADLKGKWSITAIAPVNDSASRSIGDAFITFADSSFGGKAPCNHIGGAYNATSDNKIRFSKIISTKMACERIAEENTFIDYLANKVVSFSISNTSLLLKDSMGKQLITLSKGD